MATTAMDIFERAMHLSDNGDESTGKYDTSDNREYKYRTVAIINTIINEVYPYSDTCVTEAGKRPVHEFLTSMDDEIDLDNYCIEVLALGLAAKLFTDENGTIANYYQQEYERGKILYDLKVVGETERTGTTIRFWPDVKTGEDPEPGIFETGNFDFDTLKTRFREMAFLNAGIRIELTDDRGEEPHTQVFHYEGGIKEFVAYINRTTSPLYEDILYFEEKAAKSSIATQMGVNPVFCVKSK